MILGTPVIAITLILLALERGFHIGIFDPKLGGDPVLFQHMFWFYSHPAVYIMILPGMGVISEIVPCFSRKRIFGYSFVAFSSIAIAVFGFVVWAHHMFVAGISVYSALVFSLLSYAVAIPSAVKVFNWTATMYKGSIEMSTPMLYAMAFIGLFTIGGLTGLFLAALGLDIHIHDTYFVIAHFHYVMVGGMVTAYLGGLHFWWPKITGRMYPEAPAKLAALITFIGFNLTFFPQFLLGYMGMPRRYWAYPPEFQVLNVSLKRGRFSAGGGIPSAAAVFCLVAEVRRNRGRQSVASHRAGVGNQFAAADAQFPSHPNRHQRSVCLRRRSGGHRCPLARQPLPNIIRRWRTSLTAWSSSRKLPRSECGSSCSLKS